MKDFREVIGSLISAGWTLDEVLSLTFDQIEELAKAVYAHKFAMLDAVLTPLSRGINGKKVKKKVSTQRDLRSSGMTP